MDYNQYLRWDEYYLFQEALGEVVDIRSITRDLSGKSDLQMTSVSHQTPMGSSKDLSGAAGGAPPEPEAPGVEQLGRRPYCKFQWERKRQVQYPAEGEPLYQNWTQSRPTQIPNNHQAKVYRKANTMAYMRNLMGTADAVS